jgi:hypothetical protein
MKKHEFSLWGKKLIFKSLLVLFMIFYASVLYAQAQTNFSGTWSQDTTKSDDFYKKFNVIFTITQTPQAITIKQTFLDSGGKEITSRDASFKLDGKEISKEEEGGINKESATWSPDKKILTTKSTRTVGNDVYGSSSTYSLSDNGLILTVQTTDINPFGPSVKQVFNKKQ